MAIHVTHLAASNERATFRVGAPSGQSLVIKASSVPDAFADEVGARSVLAAAGFPVVPPPSYFEGPPALLTLRWIEGRTIDASCPNVALEDVGELLARVHAIPASEPFAGNVTWTEWMHGWLTHAIRWWDSEAPQEAGLMDRMRDYLERLSPAMDTAAVSMILFDAPPAHFLCSDSGEISMIDVEGLRPGDPAMDLAVLALWDPQIMDAILVGYDRGSGGRDDVFELRVDYYVVLRAVAAAEWNSTMVLSPELRERFMNVARQGLARL